MEVVVPDDVPIDIRVKLMVCLIHQHVFKPLNVSSIYTNTFFFFFFFEKYSDLMGSNGIGTG